MNGKIAVSMMCADIAKTVETITIFEENDIDFLHIDVMDGCFVPNLQLGVDYIMQLRNLSKIPLDIHLMITEPEKKLEWFDIKEGEMVSVHYESTENLNQALTFIKQKGAVPVLALNPATSIDVIKEHVSNVGVILLMTVNPGHAGQKMVPQMFEKIKQLRKYLDSAGYDNVKIEVDGNVSFENAKLMHDAGADIFVAGSSSVFHKDMTLIEAIAKLKNSISESKITHRERNDH